MSGWKLCVGDDCVLGGAYLFGVFVSVHVCGVCVCACVRACFIRFAASDFRQQKCTLVLVSVRLNHSMNCVFFGLLYLACR